MLTFPTRSRASISITTWSPSARVRTVRIAARFNPTLQAIPALGQVGVLAYGGWLAIHGEINLGTFFAFSSYIAQLVGPVRSLTGLIEVVIWGPTPFRSGVPITSCQSSSTWSGNTVSDSARMLPAGKTRSAGTRSEIALRDRIGNSSDCVGCAS